MTIAPRKCPDYFRGTLRKQSIRARGFDTETRCEYGMQSSRWKYDVQELIDWMLTGFHGGTYTMGCSLKRVHLTKTPSSIKKVNIFCILVLKFLKQSRFQQLKEKLKETHVQWVSI